jgi:hypothetical protein
MNTIKRTLFLDIQNNPKKKLTYDRLQQAARFGSLLGALGVPRRRKTKQISSDNRL